MPVALPSSPLAQLQPEAQVDIISHFHLLDWSLKRKAGAGSRPVAAPFAEMGLESSDSAMCLSKLLARERRTHRSALRGRRQGRTLRGIAEDFDFLRPIICVLLGYAQSPVSLLCGWPRSLFHLRSEPQNGLSAVHAPSFSLIGKTARKTEGLPPGSSYTGCAEHTRLILCACAASEIDLSRL